jgi:hypothetical protein
MPGGEGETPQVKRIWAVFCVKGAVVRSEAKELKGNTAEFDSIPASVNKIYVIGYPTTSATALPAVNAHLRMEADVKKQIMIDMQSQSQTDPTAVNTYGVSDVDLSDAAEDKPVAAEIELAPAMSRLEIMKIDPADPPATMTIQQPVKSFKLDAIYINNTYKKLAIDGVTRPTAVGDTLNYGSAATVWVNPATYPAGFCDNIASKTAQSSFAPATGNNWGYYIVPLSSANGAKGTTINGELRPEVVPHLVVKVSDVSIEDGTVIAGPMYLTVRGYKNTDGDDVKQFDAGYVYRIKNLAFGLEHLSVEPEADPADITVVLTVVDWVNELVEGDVD